MKNGTHDIIGRKSRLTDNHLIDFLRRCVDGLNENGCIIIKENVAQGSTVEADIDDNSVVRPMSLFQDIFAEANLKIIKEYHQRNFPKRLYKIKIYCLRPFSDIEEV